MFTNHYLFYYFLGAKKGTSEVWVENLPGESDHLIRSADRTKETYWMPIVNARNQSKPNLLDYMSDKPYLRKEILEQYLSAGSRIEALGQEYGNEPLEKLGFEMKTGFQFYRQNIANNYGLILELDASGNILGSLHSPNGVNSFISEAVEGESESPLERVLYIGSFGYPYVLRLAIRKPAVDLANSLTASASARAQALLNMNGSGVGVTGETLASSASTRPNASSTQIGYTPIISPGSGASMSPYMIPFNGTSIPAVLSTWGQFHRLTAPFSLMSRHK